jgi:cytochrome P450 family 6
MKQIFPLVSTCAKRLGSHLQNNVNLKSPIEAKEVSRKFSTDVITSCAFGIQSNCLLNPTAEFPEFERKIFEFSV